jgi:hypothetical protein
MAVSNIWAIIVATIVQVVLGFVWFGPLFGKAWMKEMKIDPKKVKKSVAKKSMMKGGIGMLITSFIMAYTLAQFIVVGNALNIAFWIWLGFVATIQVGSVLWEGRSWKFFAINTAYWLVGLLIMAEIIAIWP